MEKKLLFLGFMLFCFDSWAVGIMQEVTTFKPRDMSLMVDEQENKSIFVKNLEGAIASPGRIYPGDIYGRSIATALVYKCASGNVYVSVDKFHYLQLEDQLENLKFLKTRRNLACRNKFISKNLIVVAPGKRVKRSGAWVLEVVDPEIENVIQKLGQSVEVNPIVVPYSEYSLSRKGEPDFQINLGPDGLFWSSLSDGNVRHKLF